jgi:hypothetical protein
MIENSFQLHLSALYFLNLIFLLNKRAKFKCRMVPSLLLPTTIVSLGILHHVTASIEIHECDDDGIKRRDILLSRFTVDYDSKHVSKTIPERDESAIIR